MRYCSRCVLPDTRPNLDLDAAGVCGACRNHGTRPAIDWPGRAASFERLVARVKGLGASYDCVVPVSGGKDSTWQVVRCLEVGLHPLAVTWRTPARTELGAANLANLVGLGVDHLEFQVNPKVEKVFLLEALQRFGSTAIPMHLALFNIPLTVAVRWRIPLVVWGENSAFEYGSRAEEDKGFRLTQDWIRKYGVTHGTTAADWVSPRLSRQDLAPYFGPDDQELEAAGVASVFLGYYFPWDPETSLAVARKHGFRSRAEGPKVGYWDYADIDCDFISIHHWIKWLKFGFTRLFDNLSVEIREGRLTREQAVAIIRARGDQTPREDIAKFCRFTGIDETRFYELVEPFRNPRVWERRGGRWTIPGFLVEDWSW